MPGISKQQIYNDRWEDEDVIGPGQGEDWEDEVDRELEEEEEDGLIVKTEVESPHMGRKDKKKRIIRRLVERQKTVYERFPTYEKDKVLDFTELFKGYTVPKSRTSKRPFHGESATSPLISLISKCSVVESVYLRKKDIPKNFLETVVGEAERQAQFKRVEQVVASGSVEQDLRQALEVS